MARNKKRNPVMDTIVIMNETKQALFRELIETQLLELSQENDLAQESQSIVVLDQQAVGRLSRMDALQAQAMSKAQQSRRDVTIWRLTEALERLESGEYGICEDCDDWVAEKRLKFDPAATKCITCASG